MRTIYRHCDNDGLINILDICRKLRLLNNGEISFHIPSLCNMRMDVQYPTEDYIYSSLKLEILIIEAIASERLLQQDEAIQANRDMLKLVSGLRKSIDEKIGFEHTIDAIDRLYHLNPYETDASSEIYRNITKYLLPFFEDSIYDPNCTALLSEKITWLFAVVFKIIPLLHSNSGFRHYAIVLDRFSQPLETHMENDVEYLISSLLSVILEALKEMLCDKSQLSKNELRLINAYIEVEYHSYMQCGFTDNNSDASKTFVENYLMVSQDKTDSGFIDFHIQNSDLLSRFVVSQYLEAISKTIEDDKDDECEGVSQSIESLSTKLLEEFHYNYDDSIAKNILVSKYAIDLSRRAALVSGCNDENRLMWDSSLKHMFRLDSDSDTDLEQIGKSLIIRLIETIKQNDTEYIEYLTTPSAVFRIWIYNKGTEFRVDPIVEGSGDVVRLKNTYKVLKDQQEVRKDITEFFIEKLLPPKAELNEKRNYIIAGSGFLHDFNFRNLLAAKLDGEIPSVSQVLSGPNYIELTARKSDRKNILTKNKTFIWRYCPILGCLQESPDIVALSDKIASAFKAEIRTPSSISQKETTSSYQSGILCVHGQQRGDSVSSDLLLSPNNWVTPTTLSKTGAIPLTPEISFPISNMTGLWVLGCVAGKVEGILAESVGLLRAVFDHGVLAIIGSLTTIETRGAFTPVVEGIAHFLKEGEAPAVAVARTMKELSAEKKYRKLTQPGSPGDWLIVWGLGFEEDIFS